MEQTSHQTGSRRLIVRIGRTALSFSTVSDGGEVRLVHYALNRSISMAANLREALQTEPLLGQPYGQVLTLVSAPVLMVPTDLYRQEEQESLYRYTFSDTQRQRVLQSVVPDLNCVAVYGVDSDLLVVLRDAFPSLRVLAASMPVWRHLRVRSFTGPHAKLYAYFHEQTMEVFSYQQNRFRFYNSFMVENSDNALYFLLAVWRQLALDARHDELHLVGDVPAGDIMLRKSQEFVKRVFLINPAGEFNRAAVTQLPGVTYDLVTLYMRGI